MHSPPKSETIDTMIKIFTRLKIQLLKCRHKCPNTKKTPLQYQKLILTNG
jgi:hypothetical protein